MNVQKPLPRWVDIGLIPVINVLVALFVSGIVVALIGENPFVAMMVMVKGAFVYDGSLGYTLYYATNFIFTGLAVAVAFHAMLFNIGGEGQAYLGGLGAGLICLWMDSFMPAILMIPLAIMASAAFGAIWGVVPGYLQAKRGSHIVITTIMFAFTDAASLPMIHDILQGLGFDVARSPLNLSFVIALLACVGVWVLIWRSRLGYAIRAVGQSPQAAQYAGISIERIIIITMAISGGLAGLMAINEILGVQHRVILNFTSGYGFTGIAVALMGRNHPFGIILASLLFGALYQGGAELDFEFSTITREMVLMIQGLIILFSGALSFMFQKPLQRLFSRLTVGSETEAAHG